MAATQNQDPAVQATALKTLGQPDQNTTNLLWLLAVAGLVVVVVAAVIGLIVQSGQTGSHTDQLVTVITTALAGLVGLFVPSPVAGKGSG